MGWVRKVSKPEWGQIGDIKLINLIFLHTVYPYIRSKIKVVEGN